LRSRDSGPLGSVAALRGLGLAAAGSLLLAAPLLGSPGAAASSLGPRGISADSFANSLSFMSQFRSLAAAGRGPVGVILPGTATAATEQAVFGQVLAAAGLTRSQVLVQDADGSDAAQLADAETDIARGSRVLLLDPINSGVGTQIEVEAQTNGVKTIDLDDLSLGGSRDYYVGYDEVAAGWQPDRGLASCARAWHVRQPRIVVVPGPAEDGAAGQLAQGYDAALSPLLRVHHWVVVTQTAGTSDPPTAANEFQTAYEADQGVNAALVSNDGTDAAVVDVLKSAHVGPHTFPTTGIGATLTGLRDIVSGYQCGTVSMPPRPAAEAAAALALYLRADRRPPSHLVDGSVEDTTAGVSVPSVLVTPQWVTASNLAHTALKEGPITAARLCAGSFAAACRADGIKP
jgi:D-xylose transport system substrate-binding protein